MESEVIKMAAGQGLFALLFVLLFFYVLRENSRREAKYQNIIEMLTNKFEDIKGDVKELARRFDDWMVK